MSNSFRVADAQIARLQPFFPKRHGKPRIDDWRVFSGVIFMKRNSLRWHDAPRKYCPLKFFMTAGQVSDYTGATALLGGLPAAEWMLADQGCDVDWFMESLKYKGITPCTPPIESPSARQFVATTTLPAPQLDQDHVRSAERLAPGHNPL